VAGVIGVLVDRVFLERYRRRLLRQRNAFLTAALEAKS
jgi:hypothetical protein